MSALAVMGALAASGCASDSSGSSPGGSASGASDASAVGEVDAATPADPTDDPGASADAGAGLTEAPASDASPVGRSSAEAGAEATEPGQTTGASWFPTAGDGGATDEPDDTSVTGGAPAIPAGVLLYVYHQTPGSDWLIARDLESGDEALITDLTGDGSSGWNIEGFALSPNRRRVALASLYAPTDADVATGLATRAIWTLGADGTDFLRLTPTFANDSQGRSGFSYSVDRPEWTADGSRVVYNFGTYWWEGTTLEGGTFPWIVDADGRSLPTTVTTSAPCTVIHPSRNPVTGDFLFIHSVCVPGQGEGSGVYLYSADGSEPRQLVASTRVDGGVDVFLGKPAWLPDGSGFLFMGGTAQTDWNVGLLLYDLQEGTFTPLVPPPANAAITGATVSPDASKIVYCSRDTDGKEDLHLIDLSLESPTDVALTTDGKSRDPSF